MRSALAQLLRLLLQWVESNSDERDIVTQVHERLESPHAPIPISPTMKKNHWRAAGRSDAPEGTIPAKVPTRLH
jgi:hypothetical protein